MPKPAHPVPQSSSLLLRILSLIPHRLSLFLFLLTPNPSSLSAEPYLSGGTVPFTAEQQAVLDRHREILSLGVNRDWLAESHIDIDAYMGALDLIAESVKRGEVPGAVVLVDRYGTKVFPAAVGYLMTDPQPWKAKYDTQYYLQDLTGPVATVPLIVKLWSEGKLSISERVERRLPELAGSPLGALRIESLMRHTSGLPENYDSEPFMSDEEMFAALAKIPLETPGTAVRKSPLNFLVLGLIAERAGGKPLETQAQESFPLYFRDGLLTYRANPARRQYIAPGEYSSAIGRLAWAEPTDPFGIHKVPNAGHTGLIASADEISVPARALLAMAEVRLKAADFFTTGPLVEVLLPDRNISGGESMGLGYEVGRFGPTSFGWDSPAGCSIWLLPEQRGFIVYLSNRDHPAGVGVDRPDPRDVALPLLARALGWVGSPVDTPSEGLHPNEPLPTRPPDSPPAVP